MISLHKIVCGVPKCMSNTIIELMHNMFGMKVISLKTTHLKCIGEQLINTLNDKRELGLIHNGLVKHILTKFGGSQNTLGISIRLPKITHDSNFVPT